MEKTKQDKKNKIESDMDILLINPKNVLSQVHDIMPPLGLASIGCVLEKNNFSVKILDLEIEPADFNLSNYIKNQGPKVIGISGTSHSRFESFRIASIAKQVSSAIFTVYGGCHATFTAEDTLQHIKDIDYIVSGEGETTFLELVNFLILQKGNINNMPGISFMQNKKIIQNASRNRISDLDSIPYSRHLLKKNKYNVKLDFLNIPATSIITSRGCPYNCSFCSASAMFGTTYTMRSAKNVVDEIEYCVQELNIEGIKFFDSTLTLNKKHIMALVEELHVRNINLPWECEIRVNTVDKPLLEAMKKSGCYYVNFGVESVSDAVLKDMNKGITLKQVFNTLKWCKELNIKTKVFFSFGHIGEAWNDTKKTLHFIDKNTKYISYLSTSLGIRIYPGTKVERYALSNELLPKNFSWSGPFKDIKAGPIITDKVPLLLQPSYGIKELKRCYYRMYWIELRKDINNMRGIISKAKNIKSFSDLLQKISRLFSRLINTLKP